MSIYSAIPASLREIAPDLESPVLRLARRLGAAKLSGILTAPDMPRHVGPPPWVGNVERRPQR